MWMAINRPGRVGRIVPAATARRAAGGRVRRAGRGGPRRRHRRRGRRGARPLADAGPAPRDPARAARMQRGARRARRTRATPRPARRSTRWTCSAACRASPRPTLVISGLRDPAIPPEHQVRHRRGDPGRAPGPPDAAHIPNVELPERVTALILEHLARPRRPRRRHDRAPRGPRRRARRSRRRRDDGAHRAVPGLHHPLRVGRRLDAPGAGPAQPQHDHARAPVGLGHENELAMHVRAAIRNGLEPEEIGEVLLHTRSTRACRPPTPPSSSPRPCSPSRTSPTPPASDAEAPPNEPTER